MKIVALLSWYDEPQAFLHRLVDSLPRAGVTDLIALDGAYALFPGGRPSSNVFQHDSITEACATAGIRCHLVVPTLVWESEVRKRNALFGLGERITTPDDWYFVVDGDEEVACSEPVAARLVSTTLDVGEVTLIESDAIRPHPMFFRALRGLHVHANHYSYRTTEGRYLWGDSRVTKMEPRVGVDTHVIHHDRQRPGPRRTAQVVYYHLRDQGGVETYDPSTV